MVSGRSYTEDRGNCLLLPKVSGDRVAGTTCAADVAGMVKVSGILECISALGRGLTRGSTAVRMIPVGLITSSAR